MDPRSPDGALMESRWSPDGALMSGSDGALAVCGGEDAATRKRAWRTAECTHLPGAHASFVMSLARMRTSTLPPLSLNPAGPARS